MKMLKKKGFFYTYEKFDIIIKFLAIKKDDVQEDDYKKSIQIYDKVCDKYFSGSDIIINSSKNYIKHCRNNE